MVEASAWAERLASRSFSPSFHSAFGDLQEIPLYSVGLSAERHRRYTEGVLAAGATLSPLTENLHRWVQVVKEDSKATEVLEHIAYGAQVTLSTNVLPFEGKNYVPVEDTQWILDDLQEELESGRFAPALPSSFAYFAPIGVVNRNLDGKIKKRKVHNYSAPLNGESFNDACEIDKKKFATVREAASLLRPKSYLAKIDLHKAFRYVGMSLDSFAHLGCKIEDIVQAAKHLENADSGDRHAARNSFEWTQSRLCLQDTRMPMGMKCSPGIFHELTSIIARRLRAEGITVVVYLDDFLIIGRTEADCAQGFNLLFDLVRWLGFDISPSKVEPPTTALTFLGVDFNTNADEDGSVTLALSKHKIQRLLEDCTTLTRSKASLKEVESVLGRMNFAAQVIPFATAYMAGGFAAIAHARKQNSRSIKACGLFLEDLHWWIATIPVLNGTQRLMQRRQVVRDFWATDACTGGGIGAFFDGRLLAHTWAEVETWNDPLAPKRDTPSWDINYMELYAVDIAIQKWAGCLRGCSVIARTDNSSVHSWLKKLKVKTRNPAVSKLLQRICRRLAEFDLHVIPEWLDTKANILADALSRGKYDRFSYQGREFLKARDQWLASPDTYLRKHDSDDWQLAPEIFDSLDLEFGPFDVDGCADAYGANSQLDYSWSDFLANNCEGRSIYANPPFSNISEILIHFLKAKRDCPLGTSAVFILPFWPDKPFWQDIVLKFPSLFKIVRRFAARSHLFTSPHGTHGSHKDCGPTRWPVVVVRVGPGPCTDVDWSAVPF